ncbi:ectoine/hydroxyectoine ABC transporter permease subunit EhuC [Paenibacillus sp. S3N08]|uniref:Ectoine/hydroxyectoine ABC transporter permease subunit EhuC n=1 Tax=Paenibacillus agricola TaxID=2716264 RepID=A0ABX0JDB6_9BACL|nr:ectoine/hydroxyectoine ABC transporter permease subunit EhuC [Paenibacillus agricola]
MQTTWEYLAPLLQGAILTIEITILSLFAAFLLSLIVGIARFSKIKAVRFCMALYVEIFRGTSLLVQLFWLYFALPMLFDFRMSAFTVAIIALGLNYGAYGSEVVRSAIMAIPKGQTEAGIALNMTPWQRLRYIILPQAFVMMLPSFGNLQIELLKGTSLVYLITLSDLTYQGMILRSYDISKATFIFFMLLLIYFIMAQAMTLGIRALERKTSKGRL